MYVTLLYKKSYYTFIDYLHFFTLQTGNFFQYYPVYECFLKESIEKSKACNGWTVVVFNISCMQLTGRDLHDRYRSILPHVMLLTKLPHYISIETNYTYTPYFSSSHKRYISLSFNKNCEYYVMYICYVRISGYIFYFVLFYFFGQSRKSLQYIFLFPKQILTIISIKILSNKMYIHVYMYVFVYCTFTHTYILCWD